MLIVVKLQYNSVTVVTVIVQQLVMKYVGQTVLLQKVPEFVLVAREVAMTHARVYVAHCVLLA